MDPDFERKEGKDGNDPRRGDEVPPGRGRVFEGEQRPRDFFPFSFSRARLRHLEAAGLGSQGCFF
jgi:hypothetical protein